MIPELKTCLTPQGRMPTTGEEINPAWYSPVLCETSFMNERGERVDRWCQLCGHKWSLLSNDFDAEGNRFAFIKGKYQSMEP